MRVVFLDIDGVANSDEFLERQRRLPWDQRQWPHGHLDPTLVARLDRLVSLTGARLVLSSTWRQLVSLQEMHALLGARGYSGPGFVGSTCKLQAKLPFEHVHRGHEVQDWLDRHGSDVSSFVILDDTDDMAHLEHRLVLTDGLVGLSDRDVERAAAVLDVPWNRAPVDLRRPTGSFLSVLSSVRV